MDMMSYEEVLQKVGHLLTHNIGNKGRPGEHNPLVFPNAKREAFIVVEKID